AERAEIFYKDWGAGQPVVFSHGWPLNADAWDDQLTFVAANGYRAIAHDRRGHGRSSQTWTGNDMDAYADDLAALIEALDLRDAVLVGHSTGGGGRGGHPRRRRGGPPLPGPPRRGGRGQGGGGGRDPAADAQDRGQSGRHADRSVRPDPRRRRRGPLAVLQGPERTVLRRQSA